MWLYINSHKLVLTYSGMVWTNVYSPYIRHWQQIKGMISPHRSDTDSRPKECLHPSSLMNQGVNWVLRGWLGGYLHDSGWSLNSCIPEESYLSMDTGFLKAIMIECPLQLTLCLLCALAPKTTWIWDSTAWNLKEVHTRGVGVSDEGLITFPMPPSETESQQTWPFWDSLASSHAYSKKNVRYAQRTAFWNTENPYYFRLLTHNIISLRILTSLLCSWIWKGFSVSMLYSIWLFEFLPSWLFVLSGWGIYNLRLPWIESFEASLHHKHSLLG
jgi:hypothetical protein